MPEGLGFLYADAKNLEKVQEVDFGELGDVKGQIEKQKAFNASLDQAISDVQASAFYNAENPSVAVEGAIRQAKSAVINAIVSEVEKKSKGFGGLATYADDVTKNANVSRITNQFKDMVKTLNASAKEAQDLYKQVSRDNKQLWLLNTEEFKKIGQGAFIQGKPKVVNGNLVWTVGDEQMSLNDSIKRFTDKLQKSSAEIIKSGADYLGLSGKGASVQVENTDGKIVSKQYWDESQIEDLVDLLSSNEFVAGKLIANENDDASSTYNIKYDDEGDVSITDSKNQSVDVKDFLKQVIIKKNNLATVEQYNKSQVQSGKFGGVDIKDLPYTKITNTENKKIPIKGPDGNVYYVEKTVTSGGGIIIKATKEEKRGIIPKLFKDRYGDAATGNTGVVVESYQIDDKGNIYANIAIDNKSLFNKIKGDTQYQDVVVTGKSVKLNIGSLNGINQDAIGVAPQDLNKFNKTFLLYKFRKQ